MELTREQLQRQAIVDSVCKGRTDEQIAAIYNTASNHYPNNPYGLDMQILVQHVLLT